MAEKRNVIGTVRVIRRALVLKTHMKAAQYVSHDGRGSGGGGEGLF